MKIEKYWSNYTKIKQEAEKPMSVIMCLAVSAALLIIGEGLFIIVKCVFSF